MNVFVNYCTFNAHVKKKTKLDWLFKVFNSNNNNKNIAHLQSILKLFLKKLNPFSIFRPYFAIIKLLIHRKNKSHQTSRAEKKTKSIKCLYLKISQMLSNECLIQSWKVVLRGCSQKTSIPKRREGGTSKFQDKKRQTLVGG